VKRTTCRTVILLAAWVVLTTPAAAQQQIETVPSGRLVLPRTQKPVTNLPPFIDATPLFAEVYARLAPRALAGEGAGTVRVRENEAYVVGDTKDFWVVNFSAGTSFPYTQEKITAECRAVGTNAYYFVEKDELDVVSDDDVDAFLEAFEVACPNSPRNSSVGIYQNVTGVFGEVPDVDGDSRIVVLMTQIDTEASGTTGTAFYAGYFYPVNQFADPVDFGGGIKQRSNHTEMLYVNSRMVGYANSSDPEETEDVHDFVESTIAHEFQHLIHWGNDPDEVTAVNEGLSEYASFICGYGLRGFAGYVARPNVDLLSWRQFHSVLDDYARVSLWSYYLGTRFGEDFIRCLAENPLGGVAGIEVAFDDPESGAGGADFATAYRDFVTAIYLGGDEDGDARFDVAPVVPWLEPERHENLLPATETIALEARGATAIRYWNAADLDLSFPDGLPTGVTARLIKIGSGTYSVSDLGPTGAAVTGLGSTYDEAAVVLTNASVAPSGSFRVSATGTQLDEGLVKYENGRPLVRITFGNASVHAGLRITPEVTPARLTGFWVFLMGGNSVELEVHTMVEIADSDGVYVVNENPVYTTTVIPEFQNEGWIYHPIDTVLDSTGAGVEYLVSIRMGSHALGYSDLNQKLRRSYVRGGGLEIWTELGGIEFGNGEHYLGDWMFRAEFAYYDVTAPEIALGLLQHPLFPDQIEVWMVGDEPLHHGRSTGTLTPSGGSATALLWQSTLGGYGIVDPARSLGGATQLTIDAVGYDRYGAGGLSDTASLNIGSASFGAGQTAYVSALCDLGPVTLDVPTGGHNGTTLLLTPYRTVPAGLPGAPSGGGSVLGAPVVALGPAGWEGPARGAILRLPLRQLSEPDRAYHFDRWVNGEWTPVAGGVRLSGSAASGPVPGGGWYRLAPGQAPLTVERGGVELLGNAPNPFNPSTRIRFSIPVDMASEPVRLRIMNVRGQTVRMLVDGIMGAGTHTVTWNGTDTAGREVATGIYLYRLEVGKTVLVRKMLLLR